MSQPSPIQELDRSWAKPALDLLRRAIERTAGDIYSPTQVSIWLEGFHEPRLRQILDDTWTVGFVENDALLGFANYLKESDEIDMLYVDPDAWRRGVGRQLVAAVESHARSAGTIELRVDASRLARPMLERCGYTMTGRNDKVVRGTEFDNAWLVKRLDP